MKMILLIASAAAASSATKIVAMEPLAWLICGFEGAGRDWEFQTFKGYGIWCEDACLA